MTVTSGYVAATPIGVAATVNGHEILESSLQNSIDQYLQEQGGNIGAIRDPDKFQDVRARVLNVMIGQQLLWHAAQADKVVIDDEALDQAFQKYVAGFEDESMFTLKIRQAGLTEEIFRDNLKKRLSAENWLQSFVLKEVIVSDEEIDSFYEENKSRFFQPEQVKASHILIQVPADAGDDEDAQARKQVNELKSRLDAGADFAELAREHSQDAAAPRGGDLGYFQKGQMVPPFEQAAFSLEPGEVSEPIRTAFGYHLIKLADRKTARQFQKAELEERIHRHLWQIKSREAIDSAVAKLREDANIEINTTN